MSAATWTRCLSSGKFPKSKRQTEKVPRKSSPRSPGTEICSEQRGRESENRKRDCIAYGGVSNRRACSSWTNDNGQSSHVLWDFQLHLCLLFKCSCLSHSSPPFSSLPESVPTHFFYFYVGFSCMAFLVDLPRSGYTGIYYSSPSRGTATLNLIPGLSFKHAVVFSGYFSSAILFLYVTAQSDNFILLSSSVVI
ncbi:hypothetical protein DITRI_Ditri12bG0069000 [Diplodiscus trichospermus]